VIFAGLGVLLLVSIPPNAFARSIITSIFHQAARDVSGSQDTLVNILERIEIFFQRLEIYTEVAMTPEMTDIVVKIMVEVLSILAIATTEMKQGRTSELFLCYKTLLLGLSTFREIFKEAGGKDRYRRRAEETGPADTRGGSVGYCTSPEGHARRR